MKKPVKVAVTGAAGQIAYSLLFRIAAGDMLGKDQPVVLQLLEITPAMKALEGVIMELNDGAFDLVETIEAYDQADKAFDSVDYALLVGSRPRGPGMERKDLLEANGAIFTSQGQALNDHAAQTVKVLVVGNPANTNALIALKNAPDLKAAQFTAMTRLDHNRALSQLATKTNTPVRDVKNVIIWGNHSSTQVPDPFHATVGDRAASEVVDATWIEQTFIPTVQKRGAAIIDARGASSAASAASAAVDHMRTWVSGTPAGEWVSMAIPSEGHYDVSPDLVYSFPVRVEEGRASVVEGLDLNSLIREKMTATEQELLEERDAVSHLF